MFIQVIHGPVEDEVGLRAAFDRWRDEVEADAVGWLGSTFGVTDDGLFVGVVRFESAEAARRNSERPEQDAWWRDTERLFTGPVSFRDCNDVTVVLAGGSDEAGFVQVIEGTTDERDRLQALVARSGPVLSTVRPDILGATLAIDAGGRFAQTVAFTNEADARAAERREPPPDARRLIDEEMALMDDVRFLDLHRPWFSSPG